MFNSKIFSILSLFFILIFLNSCNSSNCFKSSGEIKSETFETENFNSIQLFDLFEITVIQDSISFIEIKYNENLLSEINFEIIDSSIIFSNNNKCRFLKSNESLPKIEIHTIELDSILVYEASKVFIPDTFITDRFLLKFYSEIGFADITVKTNHLAVSIWGEGSSGEFYVKGKAEFFQSLTDGASFLFAQNLECNYVTAKQMSAGDIYISPKKTISASIFRSGNVYLSGNPTIKLLEEFSTGKLINSN